MAYVIWPEVRQIHALVEVGSDNFRVYTGKINKLFSLDPGNLFLISRNVLMHIYNQNKFDISLMIKQSKLIH